MYIYTFLARLKGKLVERMLVANCDFSTFPSMEASF